MSSRPSSSGNGWTPCRIECRLGAPICLTYPWLFFDSLVAHLNSRAHDPVAYRKQDSKVVQPPPARMSDVLFHRYVRHGSASIIDDKFTTVSTIYSRFADAELFRMRGSGQVRMAEGWRLAEGSGAYKSHAIKLITIPARTVTFYAKARIDRLHDLFRGLPGLGKKTSIGFGRLMSYKIIEIDQDYSVVRDGVAMRPIPVKFLAEHNDQAWMNWRPPYWSNEPELCAPPGARVRMRTRAELDRITRSSLRYGGKSRW